MRRTLTVLGLPLRLLLLGIVGLYRATLGRVLAGRCRFYPSCSAYAEEALRRHGAAKGSLLAAFRVLRCSPLWDGGPDPVPERGAWRPPQYDSVTRGGE